MFWQDEEETPEITIPDDVVDVLFTLQCRSIPVDHAHVLSQALLAAVPWLADADAGIHTIHVAGSQNGWERPAHDGDQRLLPSRRTKLGIRTPSERVDDLKGALEGRTLIVADAEVKLGTGKVRTLSAETTLFARYIVAAADEDEDRFLSRIAAELAPRGIKVRKALCGKTQALMTPEGPVLTRSLMLADLSLEEAFALQQYGIGSHQTMGCGIFLPHKGIEAVGKASS